MSEVKDDPAYGDRTLVLTVLGVLFFLAGLGACFAGPLELYTMYRFTDGGRFHYEGFGFGSFMFGIIAVQAIGYYMIAAVFIPLGYGHLFKRRWVAAASESALRVWVVVCIPVSLAAFFVLAGTRNMSPAMGLIVLAVLALCCIVVPWAFIRFYRGRNVRLTLQAHDSRTYGIEKYGVPVIVLTALSGFSIVMFHVLIMFNGIFPVFGTFFTGFNGIVLNDVSILCLLFLMYGLLRRRPWAWTGSAIFWSVISCSAVSTLAVTGYPAILDALAFPERELEFLVDLPLKGYHYAVIVGIPLTLTLAVTIASKRYLKDPVHAARR